MSLRHHRGATLKGWVGPLDPSDNLVSLAQAYERLARSGKGANFYAIRDRVCGLTGYGDVFRPNESAGDGYGWFWLVCLRVNTGYVSIALPWRQDFKGRATSGTSLDRLPAIYTRGVVTPEQIAAVVVAITQAFALE